MKTHTSLILCATLIISIFVIPEFANATTNFNQPAQSAQTPPHKPAMIFGDIPLMPGLEVMDRDRAEDFLKIKGKNIILTEGPMDVDSVYYFYQDHLPEQGWKAITGRSFHKNNKRLDLQAQSSNNQGQTIVTFRLSDL